MKKKLNKYNANEVLSPLNNTIVNDSIIIIEIKINLFLKEYNSVFNTNKNKIRGKNLAV